MYSTKGDAPVVPDSQTRKVVVRSGPSISLDENGTGRPVLVLHGGGGPATVAPIAAHLAGTTHVITPTHPGWNGTERPDGFSSIGDLASAYLELLADEELSDVVVTGNSVGGWIACEMALRDTASAIAGLVLIDSVGIAVDDEPIRDFFSLSPREAADYTFHDGDRFYADPATMPAEQARTLKANLETLRVYAGDPYMHDPELRGRLAGVALPTLVIWGDSDGIATPSYGRALARSFPDARCELVADAGHLPHLEQPQATLTLIDAFIEAAA